MKLADIPPRSDLAYRCAAKLIAEQVEFELETCRQFFGTEPEKVLELLANTPDWTVFFEEEDQQASSGPFHHPTSSPPCLCSNPNHF